MKYDFTSILNRDGKDSIAVNPPADEPWVSFAPIKEGFDLIPMWIADMNFATVPTVPKAIIERASHPVYGYFEPRKEYAESIVNWHRMRNGAENLTKECIGYENGVLGGLVSALNVLCSKGDKVLLHSPAYIGFTNTLKNNGYSAVLSPLYQDENHIWRMDFEDMEKKIKKHRIHAAIFCSPHNPSGRVWERWEIEQAMEIYRRNDVYVISDEIWSDIILEGYRHIPTQSVSEDAKNRTVALYAPSKTFNLAGLIGAYHIIYNSWLRERVEKESSLCHYNDMNLFSMYALIGAYQPEGAGWLDELRFVLTENVTLACEFFEKIEGIRFAKPQGTYMLFLDCEQWCKTHGKTMDELLAAGQEVGVYWQDGRPFHGDYGIRINLALPKSRVEEALKRLRSYVFSQDNGERVF